MIEGTVIDMEIVTDMATTTGMTDMATTTYMTDMATTIDVTNIAITGRGYGMIRISRTEANNIVVLMGHQARGDTQIMPHLPHVTFVVNFIWERRVTRLHVERLGIRLKIVRKLMPQSYGLMKDENDAYVMNDVQSNEGKALVMAYGHGLKVLVMHRNVVVGAELNHR
ncbi:hypothetical protein Tco_0844352 [Tanacetum coccineum]